MSSILKRRHTDREKTQNKFAKRIGFRKNLWKNSTRSLRGGTSTEEKTQSKSAKRIGFRNNLRKNSTRSLRGGTSTEEKTQSKSGKRISFRKNWSSKWAQLSLRGMVQGKNSKGHGPRGKEKHIPKYDKITENHLDAPDVRHLQRGKNSKQICKAH